MGHTHEDIDQLFGILLGLVLKRICFQRPEELREAVEAKLSEVVASRGEELGVHLLTHIRNFHGWLKALGLKPRNAFMPRDNVHPPHSFTYKLRMDLSPLEYQLLQQERTDVGFAEHDLDVFCAVKGRMHDRGLNGPPVLIVPRERLENLQGPAPTGGCYRRHALTASRQNELRMFADALQEFTAEWDHEFTYFRAAQDLRKLASGRDEERAPPGWLEQPGTAIPESSAEPTSNPYYDHLPNLSWRLLVNFNDSRD